MRVKYFSLFLFAVISFFSFVQGSESSQGIASDSMSYCYKLRAVDRESCLYRTFKISNGLDWESRGLLPIRRCKHWKKGDDLRFFLGGKNIFDGRRKVGVKNMTRGGVISYVWLKTNLKNLPSPRFVGFAKKKEKEFFILTMRFSDGSVFESMDTLQYLNSTWKVNDPLFVLYAKEEGNDSDCPLGLYNLRNGYSTFAQKVENQ